MKRRLAALVAALCLCVACCAVAEGGATFNLRFDEGFLLSLPEGWVSHPVSDPGVRYALSDGEGLHYLYVLAEPARVDGFEALRRSFEQRQDCDKVSTLDLNGQPFAAFIAPELNASGCATLLGGETLTFLFTPQDDSDYMLTAAQIMGSFLAE